MTVLSSLGKGFPGDLKIKHEFERKIVIHFHVLRPGGKPLSEPMMDVELNIINDKIFLVGSFFLRMIPTKVINIWFDTCQYWNVLELPSFDQSDL